jgi:hypothetical protein
MAIKVSVPVKLNPPAGTKNLRNKYYPPVAGLTQKYIDTAYTVVKAVFDNLDDINAIAAALDGGSDFLTDVDVDSLAKVNALILDANLGDVGDFATAAQGILADSAIQGPFASQAEAEAGVENTKAMTALRVAQAIAVLAAGTGDLKSDGTIPLVADWDAGPHQIRAETVYPDVATGTPPITVESTTKVDNLHADKLDGYEAADLPIDGGYF